ncbi:uncharacterized protein LAESUDRAFT_753896 [Laetiporus sulphureus 93-53]|uniref:Uncharacterized protein n=1 Tax=Laetiporus sulphureus 93-53 TaxID=1314785 RepID=A0A165IBM4_9APHY|nr:uncharacterized protein LAESUDRAFT_753896 [Laetiporus sulphureus 93-53]KZT12855.1 hypothetical protein LAESUDRAFT_753896 [Laetiporus sulphureus 93-53]
MKGKMYKRVDREHKRDFFSSRQDFSSLLDPFPQTSQSTATTSSSSSTSVSSTATSSSAAATSTTASESSTASTSSTQSTPSSTAAVSKSTAATSSQTSSASATSASSDSVASTTTPATSASPATTTPRSSAEASTYTSAFATTYTSDGQTEVATITTTLTTQPSTSAVADTASSGFLQNKSLSVGVITVCSLVGVIIIFAIATYAIRKHKRSKARDEAIDFSPFPSSDGLLDHRDVERDGGADGGGVPGPGRRASRSSINSSGSLQGDPSIAGASSNQAGLGAQGAVRDMYERAGYPNMPVFLPAPAPAPAPSRPVYPNQAYQNPMTSQVRAYNDYGPYPSYNPNAATYQQNPIANAYPSMQQSQPQPNPMMAPGPSNQSNMNAPVRRPSLRKQVPPMLLIDVPATRRDMDVLPAYPGPAAGAVPSPMSAISLSDGPVQPANVVNAANPLTTPIEEDSGPPAWRRKQRSSLMYSPVQLAYAENSQRSRQLDPSIPKMPAAGPAPPEEFGRSVPVTGVDEKKSIKQLTVRNE